MKKLPLCALLGAALFVVSGTILLVQLAPTPDPFPLFLPLVWNVIMVGIGSSIILRCDCARCAGIVWGIFCLVASLALGGAAFYWLLPQQTEPLGTARLVFMLLTVGFGVVFGIWQLIAFNSPAVRQNHAPHARSSADHGFSHAHRG